MEALETLARKDCVPCKAGTPPLPGDAARELLARLGNGWTIAEGRRLEKEFRFPDFRQALAFTNRVGALAEEQNHHPDVLLAWGKAGITLWTHAVGGLSENDFVLAAKIEGLPRA